MSVPDSGFSREHVELFGRVSDVLTRRIGDGDYAQMLVLDAFRIAWHRAQEDGAEITFASLLALAMGPAAILIHDADARTARNSTAAGVIASLRPHDREILRMVYWDQLSMAELSDFLGCTIGQAGRRLERAYRKAERRMLRLEHTSKREER
ncbi:sigma factor-like helix-turn-helix DNA-binding protein [Arthrobacter sp. SA17]